MIKTILRKLGEGTADVLELHMQDLTSKKGRRKLRKARAPRVRAYAPYHRMVVVHVHAGGHVHF